MRLKRELALINESVAEELAALGVDDGVWVLSCLTSLARDPASLAQWVPVRIIPMPESGRHCVRIEMDDEFVGWSAVVAIANNELVVLSVRRGVKVGNDDIAVTGRRYALLSEEQTEAW